MSIDSQALRHALGRFATGVTLVTCRAPNGQSVGLTANSFNSLSLDPPLVLWSLRASSPNRAAFEQAGHFAVNVLGQDQLELSQRFAAPHPDRFGLGQWSSGVGGSPVLAGSLAVFECVLHQHQLAGDHVLFIGQVLACQHADERAPLLYQGGRYRQMGPAV